MRKLIFVIPLLILLIAINSYAACTGSSPTWTSTPDSSSVNTCISNASTGDTINVSAGSASWSGVNLNKGVSLIGAGIGRTVITGGMTVTPPAAASLVQVSGFTFNQNGATGITLKAGSNYSLKNVRIDHNRFTNSSSNQHPGIFDYGVGGVVDNNTFDALNVALRFMGNDENGSNEWSHYDQYKYGNDETLYVEDNSITTNGHYMTSDSTYGARFVFRYNDIYVGGSPWMDIHGNVGYDPAMGGEIYGNYFHGSGRITGQRSGRLGMHHNSGSSGSDYYLYNNDGCPSEAKEIINNSFSALNRVGLKGSAWGVETGTNQCYSLSENQNYWLDNTDCEYPSICSDITEGVGCGPDLPAHCTAGTWFWLTDQSCSDLTGMVGEDPETPISGTMYQCGGSAYSGNTSKTGYVAPTGPDDQWNRVFTPYTYPHPLRVPSRPKNFRFQN